jgi:hypothetical protein
MRKYAWRYRLASAVVFAGCGLISYAQITVAGENPSAISVDKNGAGSVSFTLQNTSSAAAPLLPSIGDFVHQGGKAPYPLNSLTVLTPATDADKQKINNHMLAPNDTVDLKAAVTQLWDAGESVAQIKNNGALAGTLRAVRIPASYNVQLDTSSASVLLAPDSQALVTILNNDGMNYSFTWELVTRGKINPGQPDVTVPANGSARIDLSGATPPVSWLAAGTLKDDVVDSTLVLHPQLAVQEGVPPQSPKNLPVKLRLRYYTAAPQEIWEFFWTFLFLLLGALASLAARSFIPNAVGAIKLRRQLWQMEAKRTGMGDGVDSKWRVLLAHDIQTCRDGLYDFPWVFPAFAARLTELQGQADMISQWVDVAYGVGIVHDQGDPLLQNGLMPPSVLELIRRNWEAALQPIESGMTNADELQGMRAALKVAQDLIAAVRNRAPIPALDAIIQQREKRLTQAVTTDLTTRFPEFAGLLSQVARNVVAPLDPELYVARDMLSRKAELLLEFSELLVRLGAGAMAAQVGGGNAPMSDTRTRLLAGFPRLETYIAPDSDQSLQKARLFLTEMRQDFYTGALTDAVKSPAALRIHVDPSPIETGVPVHFSLRFVRDELNDIAAVQEWSCHWNFDDGSPEERGWDTYHRFRRAGNPSVSVSIVDLQGNAVAVAVPIVQVFPVTAPAVVRRKLFRLPRLTPEAKIEAAHLAIVLGVALFGVFAAARTQIESLSTFSATATLVGLGFGADTLKNLIAQKTSDK